MITFKVNAVTGVLQAYDDGKYIGDIGVFTEKEEDREEGTESGRKD